MNTGTQQLIIRAVLSLLVVTTAPVVAGDKKGGGGGGGPTTNAFSATGSMNVARRQHQTILLGNGQVLAVTGDATGANTAELYTP